MMKNIGKPCAGKLHARFDEGRVAQATCLLYPRCSRSEYPDRLRRVNEVFLGTTEKR